MNLSTNDEITMKLVHYFVTKENYQPIVVAGLENEIWLENTEKPFSVIRINNNYIHNNEQLEFDNYKAKTVVKEIKKKTLSFTIDTLSILLDVGENVDLEKNEEKHIKTCSITSIDDLTKKNTITELFPDIKEDKLDVEDPMEFFINVTKDINETTTKKNRLYEKVFSKKVPIITYTLIAINIIIYLLEVSGILGNALFYTSASAIKAGQLWRIITYAFFHGGLIHLTCNMYSLYIMGTQCETVFGKVKYLIIYLSSTIMAALFSGIFTQSPSIGASGAIFGIVGSIIYFGYHYRLYLGNAIKNQLIPIVILNLFLGFTLSGIDNAGHIGGLIAGLLAAMAVGVEGYTGKTERINGTIVTIVMMGFLYYMICFR